MSEEQRNEETEVEGHVSHLDASDEPRDEAATEDEVEGHVQKTSSYKVD
jgi:hypothetical protein